MRRYCWLLAAGLLVAGPSRVTPADDDAPRPPLAVVSLATGDDLDRDIQRLLRSAGPALADDLKPLAETWKTLAGTRGLDKSRPAGAILRLSEGMRPEGYAFVPVSDLKQWLDAMQAVRHGDGSDPDGPFELRIKDVPWYAKGKSNRWAYLAPDVRMLSELPNDPQPLLAGLHEKYAVAVRFSPDGIPKPLRTLFVAQVKEARDSALAKGKPPDKSEGYWAGQQLGLRFVVRAFEAIADELEHITVGAVNDRQTGAARIDVSVQARAGTPMADSFARLGRCTSRSASLVLPEAYASVAWCAEFTPADRAAVRGWLDGPMADAMKSLDAKDLGADGMEAAKRTIAGLGDLMCEMVADGRLDGVFSARIAGTGVTGLLAMHLADGTKIETAFEQLMAKAKEMDAEARNVLLPVERHRGVRLHPLAIPLSPNVVDRQRLVRLVGEKVEVAIGFGDHALYVAAGRNAVQSLKEALDREAAATPKAVPAFRYAISLEPILALIAETGPAAERNGLDEIVKLLKTAAGKDNVSFTVQGRQRCLDLQVEAGEGAVKVLVLLLSKALRPQPPRGPFDTAHPTEEAASG